MSKRKSAPQSLNAELMAARKTARTLKTKIAALEDALASTLPTKDQGDDTRVWPPNMITKINRAGERIYYFNVRRNRVGENCPVRSETLGKDFHSARTRATLLNSHLEAWRRGSSAPVDRIPAVPAMAATAGTVDWWIDAFYETPAFKSLGDRSRLDYRRVLDNLSGLVTKSAKADGTIRRLGELFCSTITPAAADKIYERLRQGGRVTRQANLTIDVARKAWKEISRAHPEHMFVVMQTPDGTRPVAINPWQGVRRVKGKGTTRPATREEAFLLAATLRDMGHSHLGAAALIAFELHQRPENMIAGHLSWSQYRPKDRPHEVEIFHHKTGVRIWHALEARDEDDNLIQLYPELDVWLQGLEKLGPQIVMFRPQRGPRDGSGNRVPRLYSEPHADHLVQKARKLGGLPSHITLAACRHGGMTLLGDAGISEAGVMSLSGHVTPDAARIYVKRTEKQRVSAALQRRRYIEKDPNGSGTK